MDIADFLSARLEEDQAAAEAAQAADPAPWTVSASEQGFTNERSGHGAGLIVAADGVALWDCEGSKTLCMTEPTARHIARHDPARVLAEAKAMRAIIMLWEDGAFVETLPERRASNPSLELDLDTLTKIRLGTDYVLRHLAAVYADHPDYDPAWAVS